MTPADRYEADIKQLKEALEQAAGIIENLGKGLYPPAKTAVQTEYPASMMAEPPNLESMTTPELVSAAIAKFRAMAADDWHALPPSP